MDPSIGFDCSGFVTYLIRSINIPLPEDVRHCNQYLDKFGVLIHWEARLPGDLVFFSRNGIRPTHMGIIISKTEYIHSPGTEDNFVKISPLALTQLPPKYPDQFYFTNPIALKRLAFLNARWQKLI